MGLQRQDDEGKRERCAEDEGVGLRARVLTRLSSLSPAHHRVIGRFSSEMIVLLEKLHLSK